MLKTVWGESHVYLKLYLPRGEISHRCELHPTYV